MRRSAGIQIPLPRSWRRSVSLVAWIVAPGCNSGESRDKVFEATRTRTDGLQHHVTAHFVGNDLIVRSKISNGGPTRAHAEWLCFLEFSGTLPFAEPDVARPACYSSSITFWPFQSDERTAIGTVSAPPGRYKLTVRADQDTALNATVDVVVPVHR